MQTTIVGIKFRDAWNRHITRKYEARDTAVSDADAVALANVLGAITKLGIVEVWVSRPVTFTAQTPTAGSNITSTASLRVRKNNGGTYTFSLPEPEDSLILPDGTLDATAAEFQALTEQFDDGAGLAGVAGDFYISDGEELVEANAPLGISAVIGGELDRN